MNDNYRDWEFLVDGNPHQLRHFSTTRGTAYFDIGGGIDHYLDCRNDDYRMTTMYTQDETDEYTAWQVGYELVALFNGANALFAREIWKLSIHSLLYKGAPVRRVPIATSAALLGKAPFPKWRIDQEREYAHKISLKLSLLHLATENQDVYFILKYLDMDAGWVTYYKLMEAVENFAAAKSIDLGTDDKKRKSFTNTANNFSLSGFDSRHGFKQVVKQNNTQSMSLDEAHDFVTSIAKIFLKKAYFSESIATNAS